MRYILPLAFALTGAASAQDFTFATNPTANNGLSAVGAGMLMNFAAGACDSVVTHMTTAATAAANAAFTFEVYVRPGSALGGPVAAGPGSSLAGWTLIGVANALQGPVANGISTLIDIPDILVPAGTTVGVALRFTLGGPRYFGTGTPPLQMFGDANLTMTTGDARSAVFTSGGSFFTSRAHVGEIRGFHGCDLRLTDCLPGTFVDISGSGTALNLGDDDSADIATTVSNAIFAAGTARVGSNGAVRFNGAGTSLGFTNGSLPNVSAYGGDQTLCAFWDDVNTVGGTVGNIYWQEIGSTLYIQWQNVGFFGTAATERATFQMQVHGTGPVYAQYIYTDIEGARADGGGSATIGYQAGATGTNDHQYTLNAPDAVGNGSVVSLTRTTTRLFTPHLPGAWIEISGTGTALSLSDDGEVDIPTTIGNALVAAGTARVGSNGGVRFNGAGTDLGFTNGPIPSAAVFNGDQTLLPFWDDVNTVGGTVGNIYWQEVGNTLVVQWDDVGFFGTAATERATFQLQVHRTGNVAAQFLYQDVSGARAANGGSATIGYQTGAVSGGDAPFSVDTASIGNGTVLSLVHVNAKVGASYCNANPNSTGFTGDMVLSGTASVARNDLRLNAYRLPNNAFGYFICSLSTGFIPNAGGSLGNICLGGNIGRAVGGSILNTGGAGSFGILANLNALPQPGIPTVVGMPGETWNFQAWHRDSVGGVAVSNLTNGSQVQLEP